jgi:hypothetical protein
VTEVRIPSRVWRVLVAMVAILDRSRADGDARSLFDRFAGWAADFVSRGVFFLACVVLVLVWLPSYWAFSSADTWQLIINTVTTIITFLLVALLQNSQRRGDQALHQKLDAIADGLADLMTHLTPGTASELESDVSELKQSVGLEQRT